MVLSAVLVIGSLSLFFSKGLNYGVDFRGGAEIQVVCAGGDSATVELQPPSGSPDNPLSTEQLKDKFRDCAAHALHPTPISSVEKMIALILDSVATGDSRELIDLSVSREN